MALERVAVVAARSVQEALRAAGTGSRVEALLLSASVASIAAVVTRHEVSPLCRVGVTAAHLLPI